MPAPRTSTAPWPRRARRSLIDERREDFARELTLEQGKPYAAEALGDIDETAENFRIAAEDVKRMETAIVPSQDVGKRILTFRKPNGVYAGITPWNFPTLIPVELIAPGIAAGNTIVMKPSEWTPIAMANFMQIMVDAGLPEGVVNVVYGAGDVGRAARHPSRDRLRRLRRIACHGGEDRPRRRSEAVADRSERQRAGHRLRGR
jgi:acyl-CoA reductase-like NAD-dependent aldehyde dehydrogenase